MLEVRVDDDDDDDVMKRERVFLGIGPCRVCVSIPIKYLHGKGYTMYAMYVTHQFPKRGSRKTVHRFLGKLPFYLSRFPSPWIEFLLLLPTRDGEDTVPPSVR